jgi:hypothetical protein
MQIGARTRKHTALVGLTVISLGGAVLSATSAAAVTHTVRLSVIGRDGTPRSAGATLVDLAGKHGKRLTTGRSAAVADGRYAVGAFVHEAGAVTLIARTVRVTKDLTITLDARAGVPASFGVDDPAAVLSALEVVPFVGKRAAGHERPVVTDPDRTIDPTDALYVVPAPQDTAIRLGVHAVLSNPHATPTPTRYDLVRSFQGLPAAVSVTGTRAGLARVNMSFSTPDVEATRGLVLSARYANLDPVVDAQGVQPQEDLTERLVSYRSPGLQWVSSVYLTSDAGGATMTEYGNAANRHRLLLAAGRTYAERWGAGLWGIGPDTRIVIAGHRLVGHTDEAICPPAGKGVDLTGCRSLDTEVTWYRSGEDVIGLTAVRSAEADTSTRVLGRWRVRGKNADNDTTPEVGHFRLFTGGLDTTHGATAGSVGALEVHVSGLHKVKTLKVETSTDDGHTWHAVTATRAGAHWTVPVTNPAAGAAVSVRVTATSTSGASAQQTIVRAWLTH